MARKQSGGLRGKDSTGLRPFSINFLNVANKRFRLAAPTTITYPNRREWNRCASVCPAEINPSKLRGDPCRPNYVIF